MGRLHKGGQDGGCAIRGAAVTAGRRDLLGSGAGTHRQAQFSLYAAIGAGNLRPYVQGQDDVSRAALANLAVRSHSVEACRAFRGRGSDTTAGVPRSARLQRAGEPDQPSQAGGPLPGFILPDVRRIAEGLTSTPGGVTTG
jgi:hypothetical protein